jgi:Domain of unknown function (DUF4150)
MFANTQLMGVDLGFPDVCLTPTPPPVPIPYPNIALGPMGVPAAYNVLFMCTPVHNMATTIPLTNGDNAGVLLGVVSHLMMGPARHVTAAFTVIGSFAPVTRMTSIATHNMMNCPGVRAVPSQPKVLVLAP